MPCSKQTTANDLVGPDRHEPEARRIGRPGGAAIVGAEHARGNRIHVADYVAGSAIDHFGGRNRASAGRGNDAGIDGQARRGEIRRARRKDQKRGLAGLQVVGPLAEDIARAIVKHQRAVTRIGRKLIDRVWKAHHVQLDRLARSERRDPEPRGIDSPGHILRGCSSGCQYEGIDNECGQNRSISHSSVLRHGLTQEEDASADSAAESVTNR